MKSIFHSLFLASLFLLCLSCSEVSSSSSSSSVVGNTYKLGFNAASDGWKLQFNGNGTGTLVHMREWEMDGTSVSGFKDCKSFSYIQEGNNISFSGCTIGLVYQPNPGGPSDDLTITLKNGVVKYDGDWISISAEVVCNGNKIENHNSWDSPTAHKK